MERDNTYIHHILDAITKIAEYTAGMTEDAFLASPVVGDAVLRQLEIIGEAARHVSEEGRANFPQIPWPKIVGLRNRLIHEYFNVDWRIVWQAVVADLPSLRADLEKVVK